MTDSIVIHRGESPGAGAPLVAGGKWARRNRAAHPARRLTHVCRKGALVANVHTRNAQTHEHAGRAAAA